MVILVVWYATTSKSSKKIGKINDSQIANFKKEAKNFCAHLENHIATKTPIQSQFARCARALSLRNMAHNPESCEKLFDVILEKLVGTKRLTLSVGD